MHTLYQKMKTDTSDTAGGMKTLREKLDMVEAERFISFILRENFDYTEWQKELWNDKSVDEIFYAAKAFDKKMKLPPSIEPYFEKELDRNTCKKTFT